VPFFTVIVQIDVVRSCNSTLIKTQPLVAVFVGGTSGIGEYTIRALAAAHSDQGKGLRLYIVGRNADAARATISDCVRVCPGGQFRFVQAEDLALLKDVDRVCAEIIRIEEDENVKGGTARVDLLVMSQAYLSFEPRRGISSSLVPPCPSLHPQVI
jgi:NAD(P)-dependent dehydrogenase (short-subunit alcohol dehydrogenase family)